MLIRNIQPKINDSNKNVSNRGLLSRLGTSLAENPKTLNLMKNLADPDALAQTIALESVTTAGRGYNAYKRSGSAEFRERFTDDVISAFFWMKGVDLYNFIGDKTGEKIFKLPIYDFDTGKDTLRTPFNNLAAKIKKDMPDAAEKLIKKISIFKFSKIVTASAASSVTIGIILPKINQKITEILMKSKQKEKQQKTEQNKRFIQGGTFEEFEKYLKNNKNPSFKGFADFAAYGAHMLENNTVCKMLTNDAGLIACRTKSARNKDEGIEYLFRDSASLIFYFASTPLIYKGLQKLTHSKDLTSLDPVSVKILHDYLKQQLLNADGKSVSMTAAEFKQAAAGVTDKKHAGILKKLPEVISLDELKKYIGGDLLEKAENMSLLQPEQAGTGRVLTKWQVRDVFSPGAVSNPEFMQKIFKSRFGEKLTAPYKFIPMKKINDFRETIEKHILALTDAAEKKNGSIISAEFLDKIRKSSFLKSAGFRLIALGISALSLGFLVPKLQYMITEKRTGSKTAPGLRKYNQEYRSSQIHNFTA